MTKHVIAIVSIIGIFLTASTTGHAADRKGWGITAALGATRIKDKDGVETFSGSASGYSAAVEYRFTQYFALGFGGFSLGKATDTFNSVETQIEVRGYNIFVRAIYPVSHKVDVFAHIGSANYFVDIDPGSQSFTDALFGKEATEFGLGIDFARREKLAFRFEGRYFDGGRDETGSLLMVGFNYLF
jgi:hypothetical protein